MWAFGAPQGLGARGLRPEEDQSTRGQTSPATASPSLALPLATRQWMRSCLPPLMGAVSCALRPSALTRRLSRADPACGSSRSELGELRAQLLRQPPRVLLGAVRAEQWSQPRAFPFQGAICPRQPPGSALLRFRAHLAGCSWRHCQRQGAKQLCWMFSCTMVPARPHGRCGRARTARLQAAWPASASLTATPSRLWPSSGVLGWSSSTCIQRGPARRGVGSLRSPSRPLGQRR